MQDIPKISSQEIYEKLLYEDKFKNANPSEIVKTISDYQYKFKETASEINPEDFFKEFDSFCTEDEIEFISELNKDTEKDNDIELLDSLDILANNLFQNKKTNFIELDNLLDQMLNKEEEINLINFDSEHKNIYEIENTLNLDLLDLYKEEDLSDEEIISCLNNMDERKIGSSLQRTIKVFDLYNSENLLFKDEALDLSDLIIRKLISYKSIILDFSKIKNITELFLRGTFNGIAKYLTPEDILEQINIINLSENLYEEIRLEIIPHCYKFWLASLGEESNAYIQAKKDLILTLDPESKLILDNPDSFNIREIPFKKLTSKYLKYQREKKLRYPIWYVERITEEVIEKYKIDDRVFKFIDITLPELDINKILKNCKLNSSDNYEYILPEELFKDVYKFCETEIIQNCSNYLDELIKEIENKRLEIEELKKIIPKKFISAGGVCFQNLFLDDKLLNSLPESIKIRLNKIEELEFQLLDLEHKYMIKEDILRNVFEEIPFTYYEIKLDKIKLIAYHYIAKYLEEKAILIKENYLSSKLIRGFKIPLEIFRYDLVRILCDDPILRRFIFSMKELIEKWIFRYSQNSNISKYYFDILMITPDTLTEMLLRSISLTIIKNKNPMTLRAVYSSYVSLIHVMIDSNINMTDLSTKKYGSFSSLQRDYYKVTEQNPNNFVVKYRESFPEEMFLKILLYKNFKYLNDNYFMVRKLNLSKFLELDSLRIFATKIDNIGLYDWYMYYIHFYQFIDKNHVYKIKSKFLKPDKRNSQLKIIEILTNEVLFDKLYEQIGDVDCVSQILGVISEDISMKTINRGYMDKKFNLIVKSNSEYLNYIHEALINIKNKL